MLNKNTHQHGDVTTNTIIFHKMNGFLPDEDKTELILDII